ncbi:HepT-like ribonuclease domain-containing protein [uncultured Parabacteroides sp.]|uniref:HepT-like ribonuclease domain-containing protein n=1 Tax=uncultured Parabacteroides sp. TaxID=512312 RepID=UPI00261C6F02|nr:HepT-like ribonuclease domain-containing protein [uncultured Parabacteroides sp.]
MCDTELIRSSLIKIQTALDRILKRSEAILSPDDFLTTPSGVERLESICMLLIAIGESVKRIDKATNKELLSHYPEIDWKGVMGMRDIIAHHYFDIDAVIVFDVMKNNLPAVKMTIDKMLSDI